MDKYLVVIAGPTASGKTSTGIGLAEHFSTEIISADSRQIYKETSIGTAVPSKEELARVKHHFVQTVSVSRYYNASLFETEVLALLKKLFIRYNIVLMVGGSGLYIDAVCSGIDDLPSVDPDIRQALAEKLSKEGLPSLTRELKKADPDSYSRVDLRNPMRVLKALEITLQTGRPYSGFLKKSKKSRDFNIIRFALDIDRDDLYDRINRRVDHMMESGLLNEVKGLLPLREYNALKTVGYRELFSYLDGDLSLEEAIVQIKNNSRKYARKQLTWFRKNNLYKWFHPSDLKGMVSGIESAVNKYSK